ncbi:hypothetical protein Pgy4_41984, partial [Pseudomonas savastanoi pv. glycinea str. race 4]
MWFSERAAQLDQPAPALPASTAKRLSVATLDAA